MSFRDTAVMFTPRASQALTPHRYEYTRTSTCRDWSTFDKPAFLRMTSRRVRNVHSIDNRSFAQAG
jgi:hypothetical protein